MSKYFYTVFERPVVDQVLKDWSQERTRLMNALIEQRLRAHAYWACVKPHNGSEKKWVFVKNYVFFPQDIVYKASMAFAWSNSSMQSILAWCDRRRRPRTPAPWPRPCVRWRGRRAPRRTWAGLCMKGEARIQWNINILQLQISNFPSEDKSKGRTSTQQRRQRPPPLPHLFQKRPLGRWAGAWKGLWIIQSKSKASFRQTWGCLFEVAFLSISLSGEATNRQGKRRKLSRNTSAGE